MGRTARGRDGRGRALLLLLPEELGFLRYLKVLCTRVTFVYASFSMPSEYHMRDSPLPDCTSKSALAIAAILQPLALASGHGLVVT